MVTGDSSDAVAAGALAIDGAEAGGAIPLTVSSLADGTAPVLAAGGVAGPIGAAGAPETSAAAPGGGFGYAVPIVTSSVGTDVVVSG